MNNEEILFQTTTLKLRAGRNEKAVLSWNVHTSQNVTLDVPKVGILTLSNSGSYTVKPDVSTTYTLHAKFPNGQEQIKHLKIEVLPEAEASFDIIELQDENGTHAEIRWYIKNATEIKLDGEIVSNNGFRKFLVTQKITPTIEYTDNFGTKTKRFSIEPTNTLKYYLIIAIYAIFKMMLRPLTFIGKVSPRELKWTSFIILSLIFAKILFTVIPAYQYIGDNPDLLVSSSFVDLYNWIALLLYPWLMQLGKRFKDAGDSAWSALWFVPLLSIPLLPLLYYTPAVELFPIFIYIYMVYFLAFLITTFNNSGKSSLGLSTEFIPSFMLKDSKKKTKVMKKFIIH